MRRGIWANALRRPARLKFKLRKGIPPAAVYGAMHGNEQPHEVYRPQSEIYLMTSPYDYLEKYPAPLWIRRWVGTDKSRMID